jgi:adenylate cyclase
VLTERIAMKLGIVQRAGIIDFASGRPLDYVPMHAVLAWASERPEALARAFAGKVVLLGKVGPDEDPVRQPLSVASWAPDAIAPPGVVLLAQTVRAMQSRRIIAELPWPLLAALVAACAAVVLVSGGLWRTWTAAAVLLAGVVAAGYFAYLAGMFIPPASAIAAVLLGASVRTGADAVEHRRFRLAIERQFAGYVSQNLLDAIVAGSIDPRRPRRYAGLGFLFADLRGFTTMTERLPAEEVLALLNRYYEAVAPAIHQHDGTIDNFRGDGILAIFGAPRPAPDGPRRAVLAAREMFARLAVLNQALAAEGREALEMGIGLSAGDAVAGNVGTSSRYGYSAIGDAVNVAARLQSLCKPRGMRVIASETVARACWEELPFVALGRVDLAGHAPVEAFGVPKSRDKLPDEVWEKSLGAAGSRA